MKFRIKSNRDAAVSIMLQCSPLSIQEIRDLVYNNQPVAIPEHLIDLFIKMSNERNVRWTTEN
jgi:hypothetical protein